MSSEMLCFRGSDAICSDGKGIQRPARDGVGRLHCQGANRHAASASKETYHSLPEGSMSTCSQILRDLKRISQLVQPKGVKNLKKSI